VVATARKPGIWFVASHPRRNHLDLNLVCCGCQVLSVRASNRAGRKGLVFRHKSGCYLVFAERAVFDFLITLGNLS